jgi:GMP synthase (glutamine-hydrolysing)
MENFTEKEIVRIRKLVGDKAQVVCVALKALLKPPTDPDQQIGAVSGGVDSTVAAKLMKEAIGDRFHAILVDTGKLPD